MEITLGLDISTSCTGWSLLDAEGSLIQMGYTPLNKEKCFYSKAQTLRSTLLWAKDQGATKVVIEDCLQRFQRGKSSAKVLMTLGKFNGIISYMCWEIWGEAPVHINPVEARKMVGIKVISKKKGGAPAKEQVFVWVTARLKRLSPEHTWDMKTLKSGPRKGLQIFEPGSYDASDAYVVALAGTKK